MTVCGCLLSRSLLEAKRTSLFAAHMSAFDPKRTSSNQLTCAGFSGRRCYSTTSIAYKPRWRCEFTQTEAPTYVESIALGFLATLVGNHLLASRIVVDDLW